MTGPPRLVLDTNVVVSAILWEGNPGQLLAKAENGEVRLYTSRALLDELEDALGRSKLAKRVALTGLGVADMVASYRQVATVKRLKPLDRTYSRDPDDDHVIACALAVRADFLVTGDVDLLSLGTVEGVRIVSPIDLLNMLA
ncbi:MAG TPA: putative toxin-antitoxin system toxin component, PIN family [Allosphingosinicella sp.]